MRFALADVIPLRQEEPVLGLEEEGMHPADVLPPLETSDDQGAAWDRFPKGGS